MPAPFLETPPNPVDEPKPAKLRSSRFGEIDEHELVRLLDTLDDERSKARFRESIYISLFVYIIIAWFVVYGPRVIFHQPKLVSPFDVLKQREMTNLQTPSDIAKALKTPKTPKPVVKPQIDQKTLEAMRKATAARRPVPVAPQPQPAAPQQPAPAQAQPTPPLAQQPPPPAPPTLATIPDAPKPAPNFGGQSRSAGSSIQDALQGAAKSRSGADTGNYAEGVTPSRVGVGTGVDILSDTMGVNFDPYLKKIMRQIYNTWIPLIPEEARPPLNKQGTTQIRFTILPDGHIGGMVLEGSTHDDALNRAAWGSITGVGQFPALPSEFHGPNLELRIHYLVNQKQE